MSPNTKEEMMDLIVIEMYVPYTSIQRVCSKLFAFYQYPEEFLADCRENAKGSSMEERAWSLWNWACRELVACEKLEGTM